MAKHQSERKELMLLNVRLASMALFKASSYRKDKDPEYFLRGLIVKGDKAESQLKDSVIELYKKAWPSDAQVAYKKAKASNRILLHDGDEQADKDGFDETVVYFNASSKDRPLIIDRRRKPVGEEDGVFYPGCYANIKVSMYTWENENGRGVGLDLVGVQFAKDGEQLASGGGASAATPDDFPELEEEEEAGDDWADDTPQEEADDDDWS